MKRFFSLMMVACAVLLFAQHELLARGPGGGGRGGGGARGGGARGGGFSPSAGRMPSAGRSPSLGGGYSAASRPSGGARPGQGVRPNPGFEAGRPGTRPGPGGANLAGSGRPGAGRPTAGQLNDFLDVPRPSTGAIGAGGERFPGNGGAGGAAAAFLQQERASQLPARSGFGEDPGFAERPIAGERPMAGEQPIGDRPLAGERPIAGQRPSVENRQDRRQNHAQNRPERIENRDQWQGNRQQRRDEVRDQVRDNYPRLDFWSDNPGWAAWRINRPYRWASWTAITGWVGYGWSEPTYYNYGDNVYYLGDQVYYGDQPAATTEAYAQQALAIAASAPDTSPQDSEWLPLGVFALTQDGQATGATPSLYVQLAISKEGIVSGTQKHMATGETEELEGMADKKSQRVAWTVKAAQFPIIETGIHNLTEDTAPALIHFANGETQQWLMVRLPDPEDVE